nr:acetyl co-A carboxylase [Misodendrum punctulatum]
MEKWWFNTMLSKEEFEHGCGLSKSRGNLGPIEKTRGSKNRVLNDTIPNWGDIDSSILEHFRDIRNFISDSTLLVKDRNRYRYGYYMDFDIENHIFEIKNNHTFLSELGSFFYTYHNSSYLNNGSKSDDPFYDRYMYDTKKSWKNHMKSFIDSYLFSKIHIENYTLSEICDESEKESKSNIFSNTTGNDLTISESSNENYVTRKYRYLWVQCENCYELNYKRFLKSQKNICGQCGYHLKMNSSERIELLIDPDTWDPLDEDMVSLDPIEFHSGEEPYKDRVYSYQKKTGLTEAVQTGIGQLNGIPIALGVMDFQFMGGSMGSVVGEKITRLIEYATNQSLPLIIVCASGGARMQEGSLSLMQMAKISSALYKYQSKKKLFYISILTSPTTGGVIASFGMLGDIIIAEPDAYIAFAGKRVIEQTLNKTVPEGLQSAEYLFDKGLFDPIIPRNLLKDVLSELFQLHAFFPLNKICI